MVVVYIASRRSAQSSTATLRLTLSVLRAVNVEVAEHQRAIAWIRGIHPAIRALQGNWPVDKISRRMPASVGDLPASLAGVVYAMVGRIRPSADAGMGADHLWRK